jgi:predicted sugar kinase
MALDKDALKLKIKQAFDDESDVEVDPAEARERIAQAIANAVDDYVKAGVVNVNVSVDPSTHIGTGTGSIT